MNPNFVWQSKHLGLGIGIVLTGLGLFLAVPDNANTWKRIEKTSTVFGYELRAEGYVRVNEIIPQGFKVVELIPGRFEYKALGTGLLFLGSSLSMVFSSILMKEYERIEQSNYRLRQSEFELEDLHRDQTTEVARWAIELDAQSDIRDMLNPPVKYLQDSQSDEAENHDKFSETPTGFLGWLTSKNLDKTNIKISDIGKLSFNNQHLKVEQIRNWVDELVKTEIAEWMDDKKSTFRLLNG